MSIIRVLQHLLLVAPTNFPTRICVQARDLGSQLSSLPSAVPPGDETELMSDSDVSTMSKASSNYSKVTEEGAWWQEIVQCMWWLSVSAF